MKWQIMAAVAELVPLVMAVVEKLSEGGKVPARQAINAAVGAAKVGLMQVLEDADV